LIAPPITLRAWTSTDLPLLQALNSPEMTEHLGGPETEEKLRERLERYLPSGRPAEGQMFVIEMGSAAAGSVGYWQRRWHDEDVYETGWGVLPAHQGKGVAQAAVQLVVEHARRCGDRSALHAYPSPDNAASNAVCRKVGFTLLGIVDFEYPPGHWAQSNDWRYDLTSATP
jgi:RimJ/RimL family protein N-acetyltransferase